MIKTHFTFRRRPLLMRFSLFRAMRCARFFIFRSPDRSTRYRPHSAFHPSAFLMPARNLPCSFYRPLPRFFHFRRKSQGRFQSRSWRAPARPSRSPHRLCAARQRYFLRRQTPLFPASPFIRIFHAEAKSSVQARYHMLPKGSMLHKGRLAGLFPAVRRQDFITMTKKLHLIY